MKGGSSFGTWAGFPWSFWAALLLLGVNDHLLKGSGLVPGVLTGKLSDFAGLIVAPLLLCALLRLRASGTRVLAFAAVVAPFVALKVSPGLAAATAQWLTTAGLPSRIVCDPSDLSALVVLPWSWRLATALQVPGGRAQAWLRRLGVAAAALACTATTIAGPEETVMRPPFLINWTRFDVAVTVVPDTSDPACRMELASLADTDGTGRAVVRELAPRNLIELVPLARGLDAGGARGSDCGAAEIRIEDGPSLRVTWARSLAEPQKFIAYGAQGQTVTEDGLWIVRDSDDWAFERAVAISGAPGAFVLHAGQRLRTEEAP